MKCGRTKRARPIGVALWSVRQWFAVVAVVILSGACRGGSTTTKTSAVPTVEQPVFQSYADPAFGYSIDYPTTFNSRAPRASMLYAEDKGFSSSNVASPLSLGPLDVWIRVIVPTSIDDAQTLANEHPFSPTARIRVLGSVRGRNVAGVQQVEDGTGVGHGEPYYAVATYFGARNPSRMYVILALASSEQGFAANAAIYQRMVSSFTASE